MKFWCRYPFIWKRVDAYDGQRIILMGFGMDGPSGPYSTQLRQAYSTKVPNSECEKVFEKVTSDDMCTNAYVEGLGMFDLQNDTCQGDSGGPIILPLFRDFIIGTVKDGMFCGGNDPGIILDVNFQ